MTTEHKWNITKADRPGQCVECGDKILPDQLIGFRKTAAGFWIRINESCIPSLERTQTAFPGPMPSLPASRGIEALEAKDDVSTALADISESLRRVAKESERQTLMLERMRELGELRNDCLLDILGMMRK